MKIDVKISELLTLPNKVLSSLVLAGFLLLFLPESFLNLLSLNEFLEKYGYIFGLILMISFSLLLVNLIYTGSKVLKDKRSMEKFYEEAGSRLKKLNNYQKMVIYLLYTQENYTYPLPLHDGAILVLENNMMIGKATNQYMVSDLNNAKFPYLLQPWVINELDNNFDLLNEFKDIYNNL